MKQLMWKSVESGEVEIIGILEIQNSFGLMKKEEKIEKKKKKEN